MRVAYASLFGLDSFIYPDIHADDIVEVVEHFIFAQSDWWEDGELTDIGRYFVDVVDGCLYMTGEGFDFIEDALSLNKIGVV